MNFTFLTQDTKVLYISLETYRVDCDQVCHSDIDPFVSHAHDFTTIAFVDSLQGSCHYEIEGDICEVQQNCLVLIAPSVPHRKIMSDGAVISEIHMGIAHFPLDDLLSTQASYAILKPDDAIGNLYRSYTSSIYCSPFAENAVWSNLLQTGVFLQLLSLIFYSVKASSAVADGGREALRDCNPKPVDLTQILYFMIATHYTENLSFSDFAASHYVSASYLSKSFKKHYGISPERLLTRLRMERAAELLKNPAYTTKTVSDALGYNDAYHFSKTFKKYFGLTPFEYRRQILKVVI